MEVFSQGGLLLYSPTVKLVAARTYYTFFGLLQRNGAGRTRTCDLPVCTRTPFQLGHGTLLGCRDFR